MTDWRDFYDDDELAEQREAFGIEYDDEEVEAEKAYEGDGITTNDPGWENWYQSQFERF